MKKQSFITKVLALSMALFMLLSMFPVSAADAPENSETTTVESSENVTDENESSGNTGDITETVPAETQTSEPETTGEGEGGDPTPTDAVDTPTVAPTEEPTQAPTEEPFEVPSEITYTYELPEKAKQAKDGKIDYFTDLSKITVTVPVTVATVAGEDTVQPPEFAFLLKSKYEENKTDLGWLTDEVTVSEKKKDGVVVAHVATIDVSKIIKTTDPKNGKYVLVTSAAGSEDVVKDIVFDNSAPVLTVTTNPAKPASGWFTGDVTVSWTVEDDSPCTVYVNSLPTSKGENSITVNTEGKNQYDIQALDTFDNLSNEVKTYINIDKKAPVFESAKFTETWTNNKATLTVQVKDELSEVDASSFKFTYGEDNSAVDAKLLSSTGSGTYRFSIENAKNGEYTITVADKAGHKSSTTATMNYVDTDAPVASDFKVSVTPADTALSKILNVITFGIYANEDVNVTVSADSNGKAPISDINMYVNGKEEAQEADSNATEGDVYSKTYKFSKDTNITDISFDAIDEVGNKSEKISIKDEGVVVTAGGVELEGEFKELIITEAAPALNATVATDVKTVDDINYINKADNVTLNVEAQDSLTGLAQDGLVAYCGKEENFTYDAEKNKWTVKDLEPISPEAAANALPEAFAMNVASSAEKVTSENVKFTSEIKADGTYIFLVLATNNASNTSCYSTKFFVDNKGPKVEFVDVPSSWVDEYDVKFKVTDLPESNCVGVDEDCVVSVVDLAGNKINDITYDTESGLYSFKTTGQIKYTVTVKDILGNEDSHDSDNLKLDIDAPIISDFKYSNDNNSKWTKDAVTVSFDVEDDGSGIKSVSVVGADGEVVEVTKKESTYSFTADKQQKYTVTATDNVGNTTTDDEVKTTEEIKFETAQPVIEKIVFESGVKINSSVYSNKAVVVKVYAKSGNTSENNSGIKAIKLTNGSDTIKANPEKKDQYTEDGFAVQEFILEPPKKYKLNITATSGSGVSTTSEDLENVKVYIGDELEENTALFEYIVDSNTANITFGNAEGLQKFEYVNTEKGTPIYGGNSGTVSATVTNDLSFIDTESIKVYFGTVDQFENNSPVSSLAPIADFEMTKTLADDNEDKVASATIKTIVNTIDSGEYVLYVEAKTLAGTPTSATQTITVDNTKPEITNISYNEEWTNQSIEVSFTVKDAGVGVKEVQVKGSKDNKNYDLTGPDANGTYKFTSTEYQTYTITATDKFGSLNTNNEIETLYDVEKPVVKITKYGGNNEWTNSGVEVEFTVTDKYSGVNQSDIVVTDTNGNVSNGNVYITTLVEDGDVTDKYKFIADKYDTFSIVATDIAKNVSDIETTDKISYDNSAPKITEINFENVENATIGSKVLNILTFGIYGNTDVVVTVTAVDEPNKENSSAASEIADITFAYDGIKADMKSSSTQTEGDKKIATYTFILPESETAYDAEKFQFNVTDVAGNGSGDTLANLRDLISIPEGTSLNEDFEIVLTSGKSEINGIETSYEQNLTNNDTVIYDGVNGTYTTTITENFAGIDTDTIVGYFGKAEYFTISEDGTSCVVDEANVEKLSGIFGDDDITKNEKGKVSEVKISYQRNDNLETGEYIFLVKATNNAGNESIRYTNTFIDNSAPVIENITYSNKVDDKQKWSKDKVTVTFDAADVPAENFCGIKSVYVAGVSNGVGYLSKENLNVYDGTFSFDADYCQAYEITVTDMFGRDYSVTTEMVLYDDKLPEIKDITYFDNNGKFDNATWRNTDITVEFTVDDRNEHADDISDLGDVKDYIKVVGTQLDENGNAKTYEVKEITAEGSDKGVHTYQFVADVYDKYVITAKDIAENINTAETEFIKIDKADPVVTNVKFEDNPTTLDKVLNFLTFGVYSADYIDMIISAEDAYASSVIDSIEVTSMAVSSDDSYKIKVADTDEAEKSTASRRFRIPDKTLLNSDDIIVTVTDTSDRVIVFKLTDLIEKIENKNDFDGNFEILSTNDDPTLDENGIETAYAQSIDKDGTVVFDGVNGVYTATLVDEAAGIDIDTITASFGKVDSADVATPDEAVAAGMKEVDISILSVNDATYDQAEKDTAKAKEVKVQYKVEGELTTGTYRFELKATSNAGNDYLWETTTYIDNSAPVIDNITYSNKVDDKQKWSKDKVTVTFDVTDVPAENFCGIKSVYVAGVSNGVGYLSKENLNVYDGTFSFDADYCQVYEITVIDMFGREYSTTTETVLYDNKLPEIVDIQYYDYFEVYGGDIELKDFNNRTEFDNEKWKDNDIIVKFTVDDRNDLADDISDIKNFAECENDLPVVVSGTELDKNGKVKSYKVTEITPLDATKGVHTYYFVADRYDTYVITATDIAENINSAETENIKIDKADPVISNIKFEKNPTISTKILNFLTFGLYSSADIDVIVSAKDEYASSVIDSIEVTLMASNDDINNDVEYQLKVADTYEAEESTASRRFRIPNKELLNSDDIIVTVTDTAGNSNIAQGNNGEEIYQSLTDLKDVIENDNIWKNAFEIYSGDEKAGIETSITAGEGNVIYNQMDDKTETAVIDWYANENIDIEYEITDKASKIQKIQIWVNKKEVTDFCEYLVGGEKATIDEPGVFTKPAEHTGSKEDEVVVKFNLSNENIVKLLNFADSSSANNTVSITVTSNNGVTSKSSLKFACIDNVAPTIKSIKFGEGDNVDADTLKGELPETVIEKDYGYFFKDKTTVTVAANDEVVIKAKETDKEDAKDTKIKGSGLQTIVLYGVDYVTKEVVSFGTSNVKGNHTQDATATFTIPANFKGSVFAYTTDNVDNRSLINTPDNTIVEDEPMHKKNSYAKVSIKNDYNDANQVGKDNKGNKLFNGAVKVNIEIADTYTGLNNVTYSINAIGYGGKTVSVLQDMQLTDPNSKWSITESHDNLVQKLKRTITLLPESYNYNSIQVVVNGVDNAGYEIEAKSELFSIDTINPEIKIEYNNVTGNTDRDGKTYYKDTRVATVTVRERNFDPADFDWSGVVNEHGSPVPRAEGTSNWSTNYSDYTESSTHTAILTFSEDGDYSIDLAFDDMANNSDTEKGEEFTIDTIDPVVEVSYDNNNVRNNKYYAQGRTATITVREHNFDPTDMYVTYTPSATGPDNSTSATPPTISWDSPSGDVCTGTIVFDRNGSYQFTLRVKDKSLRESTEFTQEEFVVDTYIGTVENEKDSSIEFKNVKNENAYAGNIAPQVVFSDYNYDDSTLELKKVSYDYKTKKSVDVNASHLIPHAVSSSFGVTYNFANFPVEEENDGIYILTATIIDKAGNPHDRKIMFSVNRFGSTFMLGNEESEKLVDDVYTNDAPDLSIIEINVNPVTAQKVTLSKNTTSEELEKGKQYSIGSEGNKDNWYKYIYSIDKDNFDDEGDYTITVSSEDKDGNVVSNRTAKTKKRNCPVSFVVDKTKPVVTIEGLEEGYTKEASQDVRISCLDANLDKESLVIKKNGKVLVLDEDYTVDDLVGELTAEFTLKSEGGQTDYDIEVSVKDYANNENGDDVQDYIINATLLTQYLNSPLAIILTVVLLAAAVVIIILIARKKKKDE